MSDFMQHQVTGLQNWVKVETTHGTEFVDAAGLSLFVRNSDCSSQPLTDDELEQTIAKIQPYVEGTPQSWENIKGYGARLSAPGYLDCTEWTVFKSADDTQSYLDEYYPSDNDEDDTEQN